jgi:hypothetical protein
MLSTNSTAAEIPGPTGPDGPTTLRHPRARNRRHHLRPGTDLPHRKCGWNTNAVHSLDRTF